MPSVTTCFLLLLAAVAVAGEGACPAPCGDCKVCDEAKGACVLVKASDRVPCGAEKELICVDGGACLSPEDIPGMGSTPSGPSSDGSSNTGGDPSSGDGGSWGLGSNGNNDNTNTGNQGNTSPDNTGNSGDSGSSSGGGSWGLGSKGENSKLCPDDCGDCMACNDPAKGCEPVPADEDRSCGADGSGRCLEGGRCNAGNLLCDFPADGAPDAFYPENNMNVPQAVADSAADKFLAEASFDGKPYGACDKRAASVVLACSKQVDATMTYRTVVEVSCASAPAWDNGVMAAWLSAEVTVPGGEPLQVGSVNPSVIVLTPTGSGVECPQDGSWSPYDLASQQLPAKIQPLVISAVVKGVEEGGSDCASMVIKDTRACMEEVGGMKYFLNLSVDCLDGTFEEGAKSVDVTTTIASLVGGQPEARDVQVIVPQ